MTETFYATQQVKVLTGQRFAHHIDEVWLREAYRCTRKDGAAGVEGRFTRALSIPR